MEITAFVKSKFGRRPDGDWGRIEMEEEGEEEEEEEEDSDSDSVRMNI